MIRIRPARAEECMDLTAICLRSKAHWDYNEVFMMACVPELTITPEMAEAGNVAVADSGETLRIGIACIDVDGDTAELHHFFVDPDHMGKGVGREMFAWAVDEARRQGATLLRIESDPGARPFYERMGASVVGEAPSGAIAERMLPLLAFDLEESRAKHDET